jgi:hypothetical protein
MIEKESGAALVLVYLDGVLKQALHHAHDGGEAYMRPLLRKGIAYAKTHYGDGEIIDVLLSEQEMRKLGGDGAEYCKTHGVRHAYYVTVMTNADAAGKSYAVRALHTSRVTSAELPQCADGIPAVAKVIA